MKGRQKASPNRLRTPDRQANGAGARACSWLHAGTVHVLLAANNFLCFKTPLSICCWAAKHRVDIAMSPIHALLHPLRQHAGQRQILHLAGVVGQQVETPRIVCQAVSLLSGGSSSISGAWTDCMQRRHAANKSDAARADAIPVATNVTHERPGDRPPDILSKALAKGPPELPFPAKAFYIGAALRQKGTKSYPHQAQCDNLQVYARSHIAALCTLSAGSKIDIAALRHRAQRDGFPTQFLSAKNDSTLICLRKGISVSENEHHTVSRSLLAAAQTVSILTRTILQLREAFMHRLSVTCVTSRAGAANGVVHDGLLVRQRGHLQRAVGAADAGAAGHVPRVHQAEGGRGVCRGAHDPNPARPVGELGCSISRVIIHCALEQATHQANSMGTQVRDGMRS